jgi:hypothetical protein
MEADILPKNCRPVSAIIFGLAPIQNPAFLEDGILPNYIMFDVSRR